MCVNGESAKYPPPKKRIRKKHSNSRFGCQNCKKRRIKCGEELDSCFNCQDRNFRCSFLDLTEEEKEKIVANNQSNGKVSNDGSLDDEIAQETNSANNDLRDWNNGNAPNFFVAVDKISSDFSNGLATFNVKLPTRPTPVKNVMSLNNNVAFKVIKMNINNYKKRSAASSSLLLKTKKSDIKKAVPLPGGKECNETFQLFKVKPGVPSCFFTSERLYRAYGEDGGPYSQLRPLLSQWYFDVIQQATDHSWSKYHCMMSQSAFILYNAITRPYFKGRYNDSHINTVKEASGYYRSYSLQLAQETIEKINMPKNFKDKEYVLLVSEVATYYATSIALSCFADDDYHTLLAFINGFISIALVKQLLERFTEAMENIKKTDFKFYSKYSIYLDFILVIQEFYLASINTIYTPNINLDLLRELDYDMEKFECSIGSYFPSDSDPMIKFRELRKIVRHDVLENPKVLQLCNFVTDTEPEIIFYIWKKFIVTFPSENVFLAASQSSKNVFEKIIALYWLAVSSVFNIVFSESTYLFLCRFESIVSFTGYDTSYYDAIVTELKENWKHKDYQMYNFLYRRAIYLMRLTSYTRYRWLTYLQNFETVDNFPDSEVEGRKRFLSRKNKSVKEKQISSMKSTIVSYEHYPKNLSPEEKYAKDSVLRTQLGNDFVKIPSFAKLHDEGFEINKNNNLNSNIKDKVSSYLNGNRFDTEIIPLELVRLTEYGLIENVDYRPNLSCYSKFSLTKSPLSQRDEIELNKFASDRYAILDYKFPKYQYPPPNP
ncbi:hypothetical protein DASC09_034740 [Saccharomycopsis crataegensis]|uniref:Zn(2)-C6 fungal-type domain-containing protein n=1 Tax=Saccharomycopsis crataegensis TaxID=43959 RepID=A0AAV5QNX4_9ASCO|nr:hypothetical protein DASC09_034740 [Saccharomycopsis crataegensis]